MAEKEGIYKCSICGNVVSVIEAHAGELVCCGQPMNLLKANTVDASKEKHVPVIEQTDKGVLVKVGVVPHPMEAAHWISLIQLIDKNGVVIGKRLKPGDKPEAEFCCITKTAGLKARIYCNLHGLWTN